MARLDMTLYFTALSMLFIAVVLIGVIIVAAWLVMRMFVHDTPKPKKRQNRDKPIL
jgi:flagellar biogenesis protein FliO